MKYEKVTAWGGVVTGMTQAFILSLMIFNMLYPDLDYLGALALLFFLIVSGAVVYGFWLLRSGPSWKGLGLAAGGSLVALVGGIPTFLSVGMFMIPGALTQITIVIAYLFAGARIAVIRHVGVAIFGALFILLLAAQLYAAFYVAKLPFQPGGKSDGAPNSRSI